MEHHTLVLPSFGTRLHWWGGLRDVVRFGKAMTGA